jgi:hypothetical protein
MDDDDEDLVHPCARCIMIFIFYFIIMVVGDMDNDDEHLAIGSHTHTHTHTAPARLPWCTLLAHWCLFLYPRRLAQVPSVCVCVCVCVCICRTRLSRCIFFFAHFLFYRRGCTCPRVCPLANVHARRNGVWSSVHRCCLPRQRHDGYCGCVCVCV